MSDAAMGRCTPPRKHVIEQGKTMCDCGAVMQGLTAKNARVVTILDAVQRDAMAVINRA